MKAKLLYILIFLSIVASIFIFSRKKAHDPDLLIIGTNPHFQPFEFMKDGILTGFEIELMEHISLLIGKKIQFKNMAFDTLILEMQQGKMDMIASAITPTAERAQHVLFTKPYLKNDKLVVITCKPNTIYAFSDLNNKNVIVNDGYTADIYMSKQPNITLKRVPGVAESFLMLVHNKAFAFVTALSAAQPFFEQYGAGTFNIFPIEGTEESYALAVSKKHPELLSIAQQALDTLEQNGTLKTLLKKWKLS